MNKKNISFENSFLTSILLTFNTLPSTMYLSEDINFNSFNELTKILTVLMLIGFSILRERKQKSN